jgi:hypothetical protein
VFFFVPHRELYTDQMNFGSPKFFLAQSKSQRRRRGRRNASTVAVPEPYHNPMDSLVRISAAPLFPPKYKALLRYSDTITLSSTSGAVASQVYSTNGLYDPDITGTGHQPAGFDQMMLSYEHYTVTASRLTATYHNNTNAVYPTAAVSVNASSTPVTVVNQIIEDGFVVQEFLMGLGVQGSLKTLKIGCNISKFHGLKNILDNDDYRGAIASNPAEQSYYILQLWDTELASSSSAVDVVIEYEAWFTEPRRITQSMTKALHGALMEELADKKEAPRPVLPVTSELDTTEGILIHVGCGTTSKACCRCGCAEKSIQKGGKE